MARRASIDGTESWQLFHLNKYLVQVHEYNYHDSLQAHLIAFYVFFVLTHLKSKTTPVDGPQCVFFISSVYISELNTVQPGLVIPVWLFNLKSFNKRNKIRVDAPLQ